MSMPETRNWPRRKTNSCEPMSERLLPWTMTDTSGLSKQRSGAGGSSRRTSTRPSMGLGRISGAGRCRIRMSFRAARISSLMDRAEDAMRTSGSGCLSSVTKRRQGEKTPPVASAGRRHDCARAPEDVFPPAPGRLCLCPADGTGTGSGTRRSPSAAARQCGRASGDTARA